MKKTKVALGLFLLIFLTLAGVFVLNFFVFLKVPSGSSTQTLIIEKGRNPGDVFKELGEKGVISNPFLFKVYVLMKGAASKIRAGDYQFEPYLTPTEVLQRLLSGDFAARRVTIPEGWTVKEVALFLSSLGLVDFGRFLQKASDPQFIASFGLQESSLEGYLFPDTYEFYEPKDEEEVLQKFVRRFQEVYRRDFEAAIQEKGLSLHDVIVLASIVEKETSKAEERPLVAAVFHNRLKLKMPLASDPTVIYGVSDFTGNLTRRHLNTPGPYNTYLNAGLPPTPIANPGAAAIHAVIYPADVDYLFFVSKNDGTHHFSRTEREHFNAVRTYQLKK